LPIRAIALPREVVAPGPHRTTAAELDRLLHAWQSRFTAGHSPSTSSLAFLDWAAHALNAPFQTAELGRGAIEHWQRLARIALGAEPMGAAEGWSLVERAPAPSSEGARLPEKRTPDFTRSAGAAWHKMQLAGSRATNKARPRAASPLGASGCSMAWPSTR
jgi:hypothetical protein